MSGMTGPRRRWIRRILRGGLAAVAVAAVGFGILYVSVPFSAERLRYRDNLTVTDRDGRVLRFLPDGRGERHVWMDLEELPAPVRQAFVAAEDERFSRHPGFDPLAMARALAGNVAAGRIQSGASTITQQLVRLAYPRRERTVAAKVVEVARATRAENALTKDEILELYLNRVPMGNNIVGVPLAAEVYFGKTPTALTHGEAAVLAALPKAPSALNPYRDSARERLLARRDWVLDRMAALGYLDDESRAAAKAEPVDVLPRRFPFEAPHLVDRVLAETDRQHGEIRTTIDLDIQHQVERVLASHRARLEAQRATQAAVLVVANESREVLAYAGSHEWGPRHGGYVDGVRGARSAGSLLKPFLYGLALEQGFTAADLLADLEREYRAPRGSYLPRNYDRNEYGPMNFRLALGNSLNLPAIRLLNVLGLEDFRLFMDRIHLTDDYPLETEDLGLGLAIGNPEVRLESIVAAYAMLADGGRYRPLCYSSNTPASDPVQVLTPEAAFIITDILSDDSARQLTFGTEPLGSIPFPMAWKTGTSTWYRDGWIVGTTPEHTVGVWVGNFNGSPTADLSGTMSAGPIFADIARQLYRARRPAPFAPPSGVREVRVCELSGQRPAGGCPHRKAEWFIAGTEPEEECGMHRDPVHPVIGGDYAGWVHEREAAGSGSRFALAEAEVPHEAPVHAAVRTEVRIRRPLDGDRFILAHSSPERILRVEAEVRGYPIEVTWVVNGEAEGSGGPPYTFAWPMERGFHRIGAVLPDGRADVVEIRVE